MTGHFKVTRILTVSGRVQNLDSVLCCDFHQARNRHEEVLFFKSWRWSRHVLPKCRMNFDNYTALYPKIQLFKYIWMLYIKTWSVWSTDNVVKQAITKYGIKRKATTKQGIKVQLNQFSCHAHMRILQMKYFHGHCIEYGRL